MTVAASLVVGLSGSTTKAHTSAGISNADDRSAFLARRRLVDVIIIGGNTARREPYATTPVALVVLSRSPENPVATNPLAHIWNCSPAQAIERARIEFGPKILIEAGVGLLTELLAQKLVDELYVTQTQARDGDNALDWMSMLAQFQVVEKSAVGETNFFHAHN